MAAAKPDWIQSLFRALSVCGAIAAIYGIFQYFGVDPEALLRRGTLVPAAVEPEFVASEVA